MRYPIAHSRPKAPPPTDSWWAAPLDRESWTRRAADERLRMHMGRASTPRNADALPAPPVRGRHRPRKEPT
jgi:hypothetical protein